MDYTSGEVYTSDILRSCKVSNVPLLRSSNTALGLSQEEIDAKYKEGRTSDLDTERLGTEANVEVS